MLAGLISVLAAAEHINVGALNDPKGLFAEVKKSDFDILLVDADLPDYITQHDLLKVHVASPEMKILVLSSNVDNSFVTGILQSGVSGFLTKDCDQQELLHAIYILSKGEKYYCQEVLNVIIGNSLQPVVNRPKNKSILTTREAELLKLIAKGYSNQKAAEAMNLSPHTVHTHRKKITRKLNIKSPTEFLVRAIDLKLVELPSKM
jgi:DNA-binding NarL/FixJ family response regulator